MNKEQMFEAYRMRQREYMISHKITRAEFGALVKKAELFHNPLNFDDGGSIKKQLGVEKLFSEALSDRGIRQRFYFYFHNVDCTSTQVLVFEFATCRNFKRYSKIWEDVAPSDISAPIIYLTALVSMTWKGMRHEEETIKKMGLTASSGDADYSGGIDAVDGNGVKYQVKSPATVAAMRRIGYEGRDGIQLV